MGWSRVCELEVDDDRNCSEDVSLWTRGGLEGVEVHVGGKRVQIPRGAILGLVAEEYRSRTISRLEQMDEESIIARLFNKSA